MDKAALKLTCCVQLLVDYIEVQAGRKVEGL